MGKNIDVNTTACAATSYMLNATYQCATKGSGFRKVVIARAVGTIGVSGASLVDAAGNLGLFTAKALYAIITGAFQIVRAPFDLKGTFNPLRLDHYNKEEATIHLCKAVQHVAIAIINPLLAILSPVSVQVPALIACGINKPMALQGIVKRVLNSAKKAVPSKQTALKGVAVAGVTAGVAVGGVYAARMCGITVPNPMDWIKGEPSMWQKFNEAVYHHMTNGPELILKPFA